MKSLRFGFTVFICLLSQQALSAWSLKATYPEISRLTQTILQICPPRDCQLLGLGRSSAPIIAMAQVLGVDARTLPFSAAGYEEPKLLDDVVEWSRQQVPSSEVKALFKKFIPPAITQQKKRIALVDFTMSGKSLILAKSMLEHVLGVSVETIALTSIESPDAAIGFEDLKAAGSVVIKMSPQLDQAFIDEAFDYVAEYTSFRIAYDKVSAIRRRAAFDWLKSFYLKKMKEDPTWKTSHPGVFLTPPPIIPFWERPAIACSLLMGALF